MCHDEAYETTKEDYTDPPDYKGHHRDLFEFVSRERLHVRVHWDTHPSLKTASLQCVTPQADRTFPHYNVLRPTRAFAPQEYA